jgi:hypothetical protein
MSDIRNPDPRLKANQSANQVGNQGRPGSSRKDQRDQGIERDQRGQIQPKDKRRAQGKRASTWDSE